MHLVTRSKDIFERDKQQQNFARVQKHLRKYHIGFAYEFSNTIHDRVIETDTGWRIKPGRGLEIFQMPNKYSLGEADQTKRKCQKTEIDYRKMK